MGHLSVTWGSKKLCMFFMADRVIIANANMSESTVALRVSIQGSPGDMIQRAERGLYGLEIGRP